MIPEFLYDWPKGKLAALYRVRAKRRDRLLWHPKAMAELRMLSEGRTLEGVKESEES